MAQEVENADRINRLEVALETLVKRHGDVETSLARLTANLDTLAKQVSALFGKADRPTQWGVIFSGLTLLVLIAGLALAPIYKDISEVKSFDKNVMLHMEQRAYDKGKFEADLMWLKTLEERTNDRIHDYLTERK